MTRMLIIVPALMGLLWSTMSMAETHALVVGVNAYAHVRQLKGAAADAKDISDALKRRGVQDVTTFLDSAATRDRVLTALDQMIARAQRDDLVIIAFAGHGSREKWGKSHPAGAVEGGLHDVFLLANVALPNSKGMVDPSLGGSARERIAGSEMNMRLRQLDAKGARTIFVADTCHGGGMTREPLSEAGIPEISYRVLPSFGYSEGQDPLANVLAALPPSVDTDTALPGLTFLAAVDSLHKAPEVFIPPGSTTRRGALSFAFARVIDGTAPIARSGVATRGDLINYMTTTVRTYAGNAQDPDLRPRADFDRPVIDIARDLPASLAVEKETVSPVVRISVTGGEPVVASSVHNGSVEIRAATSKDDADLVFDAQGHSVFSAAGELVATDVISRAQLAGIAEREVALRRLLALSTTRPREIRLEKGDKRYLAGEKIVADARKQTADPSGDEYYLLFNIAGSGVVQFLYPLSRDPEVLPRDRPFDEIEAQPPFGSDTLVLIVSPRSLRHLIDEQHKLDGGVAALDAVDLVEKALAADMRIGLQRLFTAPGGSKIGSGQ
jgi:hypothetical protein